MIVDDIRSLKEAVPFRPFKLLLTSGDELVVSRRGALAIAPEGRYFVYPLDDGGFRIVKPADVQAAEAIVVTAA